MARAAKDMELDIRKAGRKYGAKTNYMKAKEKFGLTYRQYIFANEYFTSKNGALSAEKAGYSGSRKELAVTGVKNLKVDKICKYLEYLEQEKTRIDAVSQPSGEKFGMPEIIELYIDLAKNCDNPSVKRAALSDLTKIFGGFAPQQIDVNQNINISSQLQAARQRQMEYLASVDGSTVEALPEEVKEIN